jgi:hypothetical protein
VVAEEATAVYRAERVVAETMQPARAVGSSTANRAVVEILRQGGGLAPRALVGGIFTPAGDKLVIKVTSLVESPDSWAACNSQLWRPFYRGLPAEFADSVMDGLIRRAKFPAGLLLVDRAGFDPVESSPLAFELAAELLSAVLLAELDAMDVEPVVRKALQAWP